MTVGIWQIFTSAVVKPYNRDFDGILLFKEEDVWAQSLRGVMCQDNEEWCKIWKIIDMFFQKWHVYFDKFWPEHSEVSKSSL